MRRLLSGWLKCGVFESGFQPTESGAPQGGVASPLLALIALHGLETHLKSLGTQRQPIHAVFYADDFVVFANKLSDIHRAKTAVEQWLKGVGLQLHPDKTKISHTLEGKAGFDFLGFSVQQYPQGKYASNHGFKTLIKPSQQSQKHHLAQLKKIVPTHGSATQAGLIVHLNPVITGWCQYYSTVVSKEAFASMNSHLFGQLLHWAKRHDQAHTTRTSTTTGIFDTEPSWRGAGCTETGKSGFEAEQVGRPTCLG